MRRLCRVDSKVSVYFGSTRADTDERLGGVSHAGDRIDRQRKDR